MMSRTPWFVRFVGKIPLWGPKKPFWEKAFFGAGSWNSSRDDQQNQQTVQRQRCQGRYNTQNWWDNSDQCERRIMTYTKHFKYLGSHISYSLKDNIKSRIAAATKAFGALTKFWYRHVDTTANISFSEPFQWTYSCGDAKHGHYGNRYGETWSLPHWKYLPHPKNIYVPSQERKNNERSSQKTSQWHTMCWEYDRSTAVRDLYPLWLTKLMLTTCCNNNRKRGWPYTQIKTPSSTVLYYYLNVSLKKLYQNQGSMI